jgi:hypothetical protein
MPRGGKRNNAGAPKGTVQRRSLEKAAVARVLRERTMKQADNLFNAQLAKALGSIMIFRIDEEITASGKTKRVHTHVTDLDEIKLVLDETSSQGEGTVGESYYFVTNIPPDNKAIDSMLDRALGKAVQSIEVNDATENKAVRMAQDLYANLLSKGFAEVIAREFVKERYQIDESLVTQSVN